MNELTLQMLYDRLVNERGYDPNLLNGQLSQKDINAAALGMSEPSGPSSFLRAATGYGLSNDRASQLAIDNGYAPREIRNTMNAMSGFGNPNNTTVYDTRALENMVNKYSGNPNNYKYYNDQLFSGNDQVSAMMGAFNPNTGEVFDDGLDNLLLYLRSKSWR